MNLLNNKKLLRNLLKQGDYWNTMNGGISMTTIKTYKTDEAYIIALSAPTVSSDSFNIILNYNQLIVYSVLKKKAPEEQQAIVPMFSKSFDLPVEADLDGIDARHEDGTLKIIVPYKSDIDQFKRKINIKDNK